MNRSKNTWVKKSLSFTDAKKFDLDYYRKMDPSERVSTVQYLREIYFTKFERGKKGEDRKGLRRVYKIIKQT